MEFRADTIEGLEDDLKASLCREFHTGAETCIRIRSDFGEGWGRKIEFREGFSMNWGETRMLRPLNLVTRIPPEDYFLGCLITGQLDYTSPLLPGPVNLQAGEMHLMRLAGAPLSETSGTSCRVRGVGLRIAPAVLSAWSGRPSDGLTPGPGEYLKWRMPPAAAAAADALFACRASGPSRRPSLEALALQLVAAFLALWTSSPGTGKSLRQNDRERLYAVRDHLASHYERPPTLPDLARRFGLNEFKLKHGFRQEFGLTPGVFVRRRRLEVGRHLLASQEMNVAEVASAVGYSNPSHFTEAFRRHFGLNPKSFQLTASSLRG